MHKLDGLPNKQEADLCVYVELPAFSFTFSMWDTFYRTNQLYMIFAKSSMCLSFPHTGNGWKIEYSFYLPISLKSFLYNNKKTIIMLA